MRRAAPALAALVAAAIAPAPPAAADAILADSFDAPPAGWTHAGPLEVARVRAGGDRRLRLRASRGPAGWLSHPLPARRWAVSLDLRVDRGSALVALGDRRHALRLSATAVRAGRRTAPLRPGPDPPAGGWLHLEASSSGARVRAAVNGQPLVLAGRAGRTLSLSVRNGGALVDDVLATALADRGALLLHRVSDLQARVAPGAFLLGADARDALHLRERSWTRGFLAASLWQASRLAPRRGPFAGWALARTLSNLGREQADTHDLGFMYELTSVAAHRALCVRPAAPCARLRASGLRAARALLALSATNPGAGTIPTRRARPSPGEADTIIDSMMNVPLLLWAGRETGVQAFAETAARHARAVAELLVRPDGSTVQSVHLDRATGAVLRTHTHQGVAATSTWARGQAWALHGFTRTAASLRDPALARVAERLAVWVAEHLPTSGVPRYDYDAAAGAPLDVSAGVIGAAGLLRLAALCRQLPGACAQPGRWAPLGRRMLAGALRLVSARPPLGYLGHQAYTVGGASWDDDAELGWGLHYALEAVALERR
jgi:unsaturated chondroitin disaccharide hydrolase